MRADVDYARTCPGGQVAKALQSSEKRGIEPRLGASQPGPGAGSGKIPSGRDPPLPVVVLSRGVFVIPTRERSEPGEPALSEVEGNLLFMAKCVREGYEFKLVPPRP